MIYYFKLKRGYIMLIINILLSKTIMAYILFFIVIYFNVKMFKKIRTYIKIPIIICVLLTFISIIISFIIFVVVINLMANNIRWPSRVDASPIELLCIDEVVNIENTLMWMVENDYARINNYMEFHDDHPQTHTYIFTWIPDDNQRHLNVNVQVLVFRNENRAKTNIQPRPSRMGGRRNNYSVFKSNENSTEVLLISPSMSVSASGLYLPNNDRRISSEIRFYNVVFRISETRPWYDLRNNNTSKFLRELVERSRYLSKLYNDI